MITHTSHRSENMLFYSKKSALLNWTCPSPTQTSQTHHPEPIVSTSDPKPQFSTLPYLLLPQF